MRSIICLSALFAFASVISCRAGSGPAAATDDLVVRAHFVGTAQIAADTNATTLRQVGALPETTQMREEVFNKLATAPYRLLKSRIPDTADAHTDLLRPLLDDLTTAEWYLELNGSATLPREFVVAVRLEAKRSGLWQTNLASLLTSWTGIGTTKFQAEGFDGWELQKHDIPNRIRFIRAGDWAVFGWGQDEPRLQTALLKRIKASKRPVEVAKDYWLDAKVDFAGDAATRAAIGPFKPSQLHLVVEGRKDYVRPQVTVRFAEPLNLTLDPWIVPADTIHSPVISFSAVRGISQLLGAWPFIKGLEQPSVPNQLFIWASEHFPFETCIAAPVSDASNRLDQLEPKLLPAINSGLSTLENKLQAEWTTNHKIMIKGLPIVVPYLQAVHEPAGDFLLAGLFPRTGGDAPLRPDLAAELKNVDKLVYYDWEITEGRLRQWTALNQLRYIARTVPLPDTNSISQKWLDAARSKLGNAATRVTLTAPNELTLVRNSSIGLTAAELTLLADWLNAKDFPLGNYHDAPLGGRGRGGNGPDQ